MTHNPDHTPLKDEERNATVAAYGDLADAEDGVRALEQGGYDMTQLRSSRKA